MQRLFDLGFWFNILPQVPSQGSSIFLLVFFGVFILLYFVIWFFAKKNKKHFERPQKELYDRARSFFLWMGIMGLVWLFFAYEGVRLLSARFWVILWAIIGIFWLYTVIGYALREMPRRLRTIDENRASARYLSKRKK